MMNDEYRLIKEVDFQLTTSRFYLQDHQEQHIQEAANENSFELLPLDDQISDDQSIIQIKEDDEFDSTIISEKQQNLQDDSEPDQSPDMSLHRQNCVEKDMGEIQFTDELMEDELSDSVDPTSIQPPKMLTSTIFNLTQKVSLITQVISEQSTSAQKLFDIHSQYQPLKEGYIYKKSNSILGGFNKRYFILTNSKLFHFKCEKKLFAQGVINFRIAMCNVVLQKDRQFSINIDQNSKAYILKALTQKDAVEWSNMIESIIISNKCKRKAWIKTKNLQEYLKNDCITEEEFIDYVETGDILLFQTDNFGSKIQRGLTSSKFDHVGIIIKYYNQELLVFDSNGSSGVTLLPWSQFVHINSLYTKISLRKLSYPNKAVLDTKIFSFVRETLGKKYILNFQKLIKRHSLPIKPNNDPKEEGYFCSELVAKMLKRCDLLDPIKASSQYWPVDFSQEKKIKLLNGAALSNEITIIMRNHRQI